VKIKPLPKSRHVVLELADEEALPTASLPEVQLKKILVPVDFSECSRKALHYAESFARQFNAEVLLFHVVEPFAPPPEVIVAMSGTFGAQMTEQASKQLRDWREEVDSKIKVRSAVSNGSPYLEIVRAANDNNVDLIVIGTHGRTGLAHFFMGSTAERVVRHAPCPVLAVREREHDFVSVSEGRATKTKLKGERHGKRTEEKRSRESAAVFR
jgi:nucleotide-binding universal stress UspA family protein